MAGDNRFARWVGAGAGICAGVVLASSAFAGGFAVREQSSYYQGMSFAGAAAGDDLSAMFWNAAAAAAAPGMNTSGHAAVILPDTEITATGGTLLTPLTNNNSGDIGDATLVPASYANYQVNESLFAGVAINSAYGFATKPNNQNFAGTPIANSSRIFSLTFNPNLAYQIDEQWTVGVGLQALYADVRLTTTDPTRGLGGLPSGREIDADDVAFGGTAGVIWSPTDGTRIGVGYRSSIDVEAEGTCRGAGLSNISAGNPAGCLTNPDIEAELTLPDLVTASFSHQVNDRWRLLGTVEWANWSRVPTVVDFVDGNGNVVDEFPLGYKDGWFYSGGIEYAYTQDVTLRSGAGYELSPIEDDIRNVSLPDNDRFWLSAGFTARLTENTKLDFGYTHLFIEDSPITEASATPGVNAFEGEADGDIDIVTIGITHRWGGGRDELEPLK